MWQIYGSDSGSFYGSNNDIYDCSCPTHGLLKCFPAQLLSRCASTPVLQISGRADCYIPCLDSFSSAHMPVAVTTISLNTLIALAVV